MSDNKQMYVKYELWGFRAKRKHPFDHELLGVYATRSDAEDARGKVALKQYTRVYIDERHYEIGG